MAPLYKIALIQLHPKVKPLLLPHLLLQRQHQFLARDQLTISVYSDRRPFLQSTITAKPPNSSSLLLRKAPI